MEKRKESVKKMGYLIGAQVLLIAGFCFCIYVDLFSLNAHLARNAKKASLILGALGFFFCIISAVAFFVFLGRSDADSLVKAVVSDSFVLYIVTDTVFCGIGLAVAIASSLLKIKLRPLALFLMPMWSAVSLFWTFVCAVWSDFADFDASPYVIIYGISLVLVLFFSAFFLLSERAALLSNRGSREEIIRKRNEKAQKKKNKTRDRKRIAEKKKRLKNPKMR